MRLKLPLLLGCLLLGMGWSSAQCVYTAQPGSVEGIDATCYRYPICLRPNGNPRPCDTTNRANSPHLYASVRNVGGIEQKIRSFLKFDLSEFGRIDSAVIPTSATLNLYYYRNAVTDDDHINPGDANGNSFVIERIVQDWAEDTIRWMDPVSSGNLRMPRASRGSDAADRIVVPATTSPTQDVTVNISEMVRFWMLNPDSNFGFRIMLIDESTERQVHFCSSDYPDQQYRPQITIDFPDVSANAGNDTLLCEGNSFRFNPRGGANYLWIPLDPNNDILNRYDIKRPVIDPTQSQSFAVEVSIGNCSDKDTISLDFAVPTNTNILNEDTFLCSGDSLAIEATGGTFFNWSPGKFITDSTAPSTFITPDTSTWVYLESSDPGDQCAGQDSFFIDLKTKINGSVSFTDTTICAGDSVQLVASGGVLYSWTPNDSISDTSVADPFVRPADSTTYIVEISDVNACEDYQTVQVNVTGASFAYAGPDQTICFGDTVRLRGEGNGTFAWSPSASLSDPFFDSPLAFPQSSTTYLLRVSGDGSCVGFDSVRINVNSKPQISASPGDTTVCEGSDVGLSASGTTNFVWSTGDSTPSVVLNIADRTIIKVVGNDGNCSSDTLSFVIDTRRCQDPVILAPKFFSPNNDGYNDYWVLDDITNFPENQVTIINKWGDIVLNKTNYDNRWDGTYNGQQVAEDTYMYVIRVKDPNSGSDEWKEIKGTVTIVR